MDANTLPEAAFNPLRMTPQERANLAAWATAITEREAKQEEAQLAQQAAHRAQQVAHRAQQELSLAAKKEAEAAAKLLPGGAPGVAPGAGGGAAEQQPGAPPSPVHQESPPSGVQGVHEEEMPLAMPNDEADHGAHAGAIGVAANIGMAAAGGGGGALPVQAQADAPVPAGVAAEDMADAEGDAEPAPTGAAAAAAASQAVAESPGDELAAAAVPVAAAPAPPSAQAPSLSNANGAAAAAPALAANGPVRVEPTPTDASYYDPFLDMVPDELIAAIGKKQFPAHIYENKQTKEPAYLVDIQVWSAEESKPLHAPLPESHWATLKTLREALDFRNKVLADAATKQKFWTENKGKKEARFQAAARAYVQQNGGAAAPVAAPVTKETVPPADAGMEEEEADGNVAVANDHAPGPGALAPTAAAGPMPTVFAAQMQAAAATAAVVAAVRRPQPAASHAESASVASGIARMAGAAAMHELGRTQGAGYMPPPALPPVQQAGGHRTATRRGRDEEVDPRDVRQRQMPPPGSGPAAPLVAGGPCAGCGRAGIAATPQWCIDDDGHMLCNPCGVWVKRGRFVFRADGEMMNNGDGSPCCRAKEPCPAHRVEKRCQSFRARCREAAAAAAGAAAAMYDEGAVDAEMDSGDSYEEEESDSDDTFDPRRDR